MYVTFSQVCPPGLHITLGRLCDLLEDQCHQLDLQTTTRQCGSSSTTFSQYVQAKARKLALEEEKTQLVSETIHAQNQLVVFLLTIQNPLQNSQVQSVSQNIKANEKRLSDIVRKFN